jgi:hypothetical protein
VADGHGLDSSMDDTLLLGWFSQNGHALSDVAGLKYRCFLFLPCRHAFTPQKPALVPLFLTLALLLPEQQIPSTTFLLVSSLA